VTERDEKRKSKRKKESEKQGKGKVSLCLIKYHAIKTYSVFN